MWKEISRSENKPEGFKRMTHALEIAGMGCLVQVTAERSGHGRTGVLSTSVTFVPCVHLETVEATGDAEIVADNDNPLTPAQISTPLVEAAASIEPSIEPPVTEPPVVEPVLIADPEAPEPQVVEAAPATKSKKK